MRRITAWKASEDHSMGSMVALGGGVMWSIKFTVRSCDSCWFVRVGSLQTTKPAEWGMGEGYTQRLCDITIIKQVISLPSHLSSSKAETFKSCHLWLLSSRPQLMDCSATSDMFKCVQWDNVFSTTPGCKAVVRPAPSCPRAYYCAITATSVYDFCAMISTQRTRGWARDYMRILGLNLLLS